MERYSKETKNNLYGPHQREFLEAGEKQVLSQGPQDHVALPDNVVDPIVSNNIAQAEFDYTYDSILKTSEDEEETY
ncbi:hypothetical protein [Oceanirhabdus sp. W0125-5]|uniref:hypothetical protein n=1 Tax=Oceanirhabdus sp. W0125-5 TaxID=2999116 RepID=UPI0022F2ACA7|nr:hypothetical protein [Oceanirhabdus sp. W0125-5]WBW98759.1 hypothetical protein OW730_08365 [Oceanirhabdus sp. W0125-5]